MLIWHGVRAWLDYGPLAGLVLVWALLWSQVFVQDRRTAREARYARLGMPPVYETVVLENGRERLRVRHHHALATPCAHVPPDAVFAGQEQVRSGFSQLTRIYVNTTQPAPRCSDGVEGCRVTHDKRRGPLPAPKPVELPPRHEKHKPNAPRPARPYVSMRPPAVPRAPRPSRHWEEKDQ